MSPARARTSPPAIIAAARDLLEEGGQEAVSMAAIAERVGVRPPSLYKHFADRSAVVGAVATAVAQDLRLALEEALERAGPDAPDRLRVLADGYRAFAHAMPHGIALLFANAGPGTAPTLEAQAEAARPVLQVIEEIVGPAHALAGARVVTAFAHGFTSMEAAGAFRFGGDVDAAWGLGISVLVAGLARDPAG